jgi:hypothetical protein
MHVALLRTVVESLDGAGIPHMVAGSFASTFHSDPRMTRDINLVIDPESEEPLIEFVGCFDQERFYVGNPIAAFAERGMFNIIDTQTGWKADLMIRKDRPFSVREFARREPATISGVATFVASVEDTILAKLDWSRDSESTRQLEDVVGMLRARSGSVDFDYLAAGAIELGVGEALARAQTAAEPS